MKSRILRFFAYLAYAGLALVLFVLSAYISFSFFVRSGATRTPDVKGLPADEAFAVLADHGLTVEESRVADRYSESVPAGSVLSQRPQAGSLVKRGNRIVVAVSLGPQRLTVPDLSGLTLPASQVALSAVGLELGKSLSVWSQATTTGAVVSQFPSAGSQTSPAQKVDVLISRGSTGEVYVMPDLVYRDYDTVRRFFDVRGLRMGNVRFEPYEGIPEGVILRQFPLAGHPLARRDAISLVVAAEDRTQENTNALDRTDRSLYPGR